MGLQTEENKELSEKLGKIVSKNPSKWIKESKIKELIKEIEKVENFYLDKKGVLIKLREIIKDK